MVGRHYLVSGRVQGVGYRRFVYKQALDLGILGKVRNLLDGRVEILALVPSEMVLEFESRLRMGPNFASVADLSVEPIAGSPRELSGLTEFSVLEDGGAPWRIDG